LHFVPAGQTVLQPPPAQLTLQVLFGAHCRLQLPPAQSNVQVAPFSHFMSHLPPSQRCEHVSPALQTDLQPPSLQLASAEADADAAPDVAALAPVLDVLLVAAPGAAFDVPELDAAFDVPELDEALPLDNAA
jgi:hypothetical protein